MIASKSVEWLSEVASKLTGSDDAAADIEGRKEALFAKYAQCNQQHVFNHWSSLKIEQKIDLLEQLDQIKVEKLAEYIKDATSEKESSDTKTNGFYDLGAESSVDVIKPFSGKVVSINNPKDNKYLVGRCYKTGLDAITANKVAAVLLAGGQGTRLGFDGPKGMYNIGLPSKRTLFRLVCERIRKLTQLASDGNVDSRVHIPLYVMTSPMNHKVTKDYFESNSFFGLPSTDVKFFSQGTLPCLSNDGSIIMESQFQCAMAPDGNGGIYPAMEKFGVLDDMKERGVEHIHAFAIDNALVRPADPVFIGHCINEKADCGNKVVWKKEAGEKVGVIAEKNGKPCVIEYSELSLEMAQQTKGMMGRKKLLFGAGNICNHYYSISFLEDKVMPEQGKKMHVANKKIPFWNESTNTTVTPTENNGIKLESFIFDVFPLSTDMAIVEVEREEEFAPVKNAPGSSSDSPESAREKLSILAKRWLENAGAKLIEVESGSCCEIGPLTSYSGEGLDSYKKEEVECPFSI